MRCFGHSPHGVVCVLCSSKRGGEMVERLVAVFADAVFYQFAGVIKCSFVLKGTSLLPAVDRLWSDSAEMWTFHKSSLHSINKLTTACYQYDLKYSHSQTLSPSSSISSTFNCPLHYGQFFQG